MSEKVRRCNEMEVIPFLRGLTFDGQKGLCFSRISPEDGRSVLSLPDGGLEVCREAFSSFTGENGRYPDAVQLPDGSRYALGADVAEAEAAQGCTRLPEDAGSTARDDVVRGKIALVTGGAGGFGAGMARSLVDAGAFVFVADVQEESARALADELNERKGGSAAAAVGVDVTSEESVQAMMEQVVRTAGGLDLCISNAGVLRAGSVKELPLTDFQFVTAVDYTGFFICTKFASRIMAAQHAGDRGYMSDIIVISSKSGLEGSNRNAAYAGAKFGTIGLTQSFALELIEDGIKVNAVCPGNFLDGPLWSDPGNGLFVQYLKAGKVPGAESTGDVRRYYESRVPLGRGCRTEDVMRAVFYCVEQRYETGQAVPVTGGQVMLN